VARHLAAIQHRHCFVRAQPHQLDDRQRDRRRLPSLAWQPACDGPIASLMRVAWAQFSRGELGRLPRVITACATGHVLGRSPTTTAPAGDAGSRCAKAKPARWRSAVARVYCGSARPTPHGFVSDFVSGARRLAGNGRHIKALAGQLKVLSLHHFRRNCERGR
jgi:hypothetical protein